MDNNDVYSYKIERENEKERYYVSFVNTNKELKETEVPQDTFLALQEFNRKRESISRSDRRHIERSELKFALEKLTEEERDIVLLSILGGLKSREIAKISSLTSGSVRSKLSRSLAKMREYLE